MVDILLKVLIGAVAVSAAGGAAYAVYKILTRDQIKEDIKEKTSQESSQEVLDKMFDAKIKQKLEKGEVFSIDCIDSWGQEGVVIDIRDKYGNVLKSGMRIMGDQIGDDVTVGTVIKLVD